MKISELLSSKKLTREGALRLVESLLEGETQVDVNTGEIYICYGSEPQSYSTVDSVLGYTDVDDMAEELNYGYNIMEPYDNMKAVMKLIGI